MGASGWHYTTPYDPDPEAALQRLRAEVFESGDYLLPGEVLRVPGEVLAGLPLRFRLALALVRAIGAAVRAYHWVTRGGRRPRTIEELLEMAGESGTHSILDIAHTADIPEFGAATPLTKHRHLQLFGTTTPTRAQVEAAQAAPAGPDEGIRRWEAVYFVVHDEAGSPLEYVFVGCSGD
jgi:hypothetical protein